MNTYPAIKAPFVTEDMQGKWAPYLRNADNLVRYWAVPGTEGFAHRIGGLEKDANSGVISTDPANHQLMTDLRQAKIDKIADYIPQLQIEGNADADVLVVGWGGTYGHLYAAVEELNKEGKACALAHFNYINPLPKNTAEVLSKYKKIIVCELNNGQFAAYLRSKMPMPLNISQLNKVEAQPFAVEEVKAAVNKLF